MKKTTKNDLNTTSSGCYTYNKHKKEQKQNGLDFAEKVVIKGILHNQPYARVGKEEFLFKNKLYQKIYEQNLKLNEIDDKLDAIELQEIAPLRIGDEKSLSPQEQAIQWKECYMVMRISFLKQERERFKNDMVKVQTLSLQIKKLENEKKMVKLNVEEK